MAWFLSLFRTETFLNTIFMKKSSLLCLIFLFFGTFCGCKKETTTTTTEQNKSTKTTSLLEDTWWIRHDGYEHCFFGSNGQYYYLKGRLNVDVSLNDTTNSYLKGTWNWINGDTLFIHYGGVQQGTCIVRKLLPDTMIMDVNITGNYPLNGYSWVK